MPAPRRKKTTTRRRKSARTKSHKLPNWTLLLLGLAIGVVLTFVIQLVADRGRTPGTGINSLLNRPEKPVPKKPLIAKPAPPPKPTYDFYTILPEVETVIPDREWKGIGRTKDTGARYVLQAASFKDFNDADRMKARLALNGLVSEIQKVTIGNKGTYYRVRLGPFELADDADAANQQLAKMGIKALRLKVKGGN